MCDLLIFLQVESPMPCRGYLADGNFGWPKDTEPQLRVGDHTDAGKCAALWEESEALIGGAIGAE